MTVTIYKILLTYLLKNVLSSSLEKVIVNHVASCNNDMDLLQKLKKIPHDNNITRIDNYTMIIILYDKEYYHSLFYLIDSFLIKTKEEGLMRDIISLKNYTYDNRSESDRKNIIRILPLCEWAQNHTNIKMRVKFAKGLEVPGEKNIIGFNVSLTNTRLTLSGYKEHEDYFVWYYRIIELFAVVKPKTLKYYQETEGSFIIHFDKGVYTMYWNFLDLDTGSHMNIFTWFDVFEKYDNEVKYVEYREWTRDNLLLSDMQYYIDEKLEEKKQRQNKINKLLEEIEVKGSEIDYYCNTIPFESKCAIKNIYDWNYWLN